MARLDRTPQGLAPIDQRYTESAIESSYSSFSQAGPRPGVSVATNAKQNAAPVLSGAQETGIDLKVSKSGDPSIERRGAAYLWKTDAEGSDDYRGWASPIWWTRSSTIHFSGVSAITTLDASVDHDSQGVSIIYAEGSTTPLSWRRLTESDQTLSASAQVLTVGGGAGSMVGPASITALPDGRRIVLEFDGPANLQGPTVYSQDTPTGSWTELSDDPFPGGTSFISGSVQALWIRYARGQIICLITDSLNQTHQLASADLGASFRFVETISGTAGNQGAGVDVFPDGTILVAFHDSTNNKLRTRRLGSAFEPISEAANVDLPTPADVTQQEVPLSVSVDADGTAYVLAYDTVNQGAGRVYLMIYESTDGGLSWTQYASAPLGSIELGDFDLIRSVCAFGRLYVLAALTTTSGATLHWTSGWSNVTPGKTHTNTARTGFAGSDQATAGFFGNWWSCALPSSGNTGYAPFGAGTHTLVGSSDDQYLQIVTTANTEGFNGNQATVTAGASAAVCWSMRVSSGGGLSSNLIAMTLRHRTLAGAGITLNVRYSTTGVRLTDGTNSRDAALTTTDRRDYLLELVGTTARLYSRPDPSEVWDLLGSIIGVATSGTPTFARTSWGHLASGTATSHWWHVSHRHEGADILRSFGSGISDQVGKRIAGNAYPLPAVGSSSLAAFLRVVGGHNRAIGTPDFNLDPSYDFPIGAVFPDQSPSPSAKWRSTGTAAVVDLVVELQSGVDSRLDEALPVVVLRGANFRTMEIATGTAAPVFTTQMTLDLAADLPSTLYTRSGDAITINGPPIGSGDFRWLHADELVGGSLDFGSGVVRKILSHTAGYPSNAATVVPIFRIEDPGSVPASGTMQIVHHSGVAVLSEYTPATTRFWRFRIPVQTTADGYFEAGTIALGAAIVPGKRWAEGFTMAVEPIVASSDSQSGTRRLEERGEPRRRLTVSWAHGSKLDRLRANPATVDTLSAGASTPVLAGRDDVIWQLEALQRRSRSGQLPLVVLPKIPATYTTITDPSLYLFGVLEGTVQSAQVVGDEGVSEYVRIESLTVTELV